MVAGPDSGNEDVIEVQFVSMTVEDNSLTSLDYFSSPNSPNNFLGGFVSGLKHGRPLAYMRGNVEKALSGPCSRGNGRSWSRLTQLGTSCSAGHAAHQEGGLGFEDSAMVGGG
jgi:hypothetical protein